MTVHGERRLRLGVLLSGGGRTLQNLLDRCGDGRLRAEVACVVADREGVMGIERAQRAGVPVTVTKDMGETFAWLERHGVELACLAGYLRLLKLPSSWRGRVLNIHPALLPKFGGKGMHGEHVHEAVIAANERESGCTVHVVDEEYDHGAMLLQARVPAREDDDVASLAARVFAAECAAYPAAIELWRVRRI
ncbi:MAG: phosphoribosylglycinamide formyltransferase [Planctomycetes bacterium]|nr:phosphoribosylglycinamide formyltransferase [Planctomycetota bacterium]